MHRFLGIAILTCTAAAAEVGTPLERVALLDELVRKTLLREAWSPPKSAALDVDVVRDAAGLRDVFRDADDPHELLHAIWRFSNLRHDGHLEVKLTEKGLRYRRPYLDEAPVRLGVDFSRQGEEFLFVRDVAKEWTDELRPGDRVVGVNGVAAAAHYALIEPYLAYSTRARLWVELAINVPVRRADLGEEVYSEEGLSLELERGGETFEVLLPWLEPEDLTWTGASIPEPFDGRPWEEPPTFAFHQWCTVKTFEGFTLVDETESYRLHVPDDPADELVVLEWRRMKAAMPGHLERLMALAAERELLDHDVVLDLTGARGGRQAWLLLSHLVSRPFRVTHGNLRLSDVTPWFVVNLAGTTRLRDWLRGPVTEAYLRGDAYSPAAPFKHRVPADDEGKVPPAAVHFRGRLVALTGPFARSQVDHLAAMIADNDLGPLLGLPTGGSSNSWEWTETLRLPNSRLELCSFMWSCGHTLRPGGEVLEGNPAPVDERIPPTRENFVRYHEILLAAAREQLR